CARDGSSPFAYW
nr:immunoglobulin heavy chain junction region [Mus musculus]